METELARISMPMEEKLDPQNLYHFKSREEFQASTPNFNWANYFAAIGAPVVVAIMRREKGLHVFDHLATLRPDPTKDRKEEAVRLTRETMALLDAAIQKTPEHWFWYNKRWLLQPV